MVRISEIQQFPGFFLETLARNFLTMSPLVPSIRQKIIRLPFCRNFQWRIEQHFPEFQESPSRNFLGFRLNVSHFKNSTISGFSGHFRKKFTDQISSFLNFRNN